MLFIKSKRLYWNFLLVLVPLVLTSCGSIRDTDNPLTGKSTDERIIMSLQDTYPEHKFTVVESFDKKENEGVFADENGIEFRVTNVTYDNIYHFGCTDEYLYTLLMKQGYVEKVKSIARNYNLELRQVERLSILVQLEEDIDYIRLAQVVLEILNCVEVPEVIYPKEQGFSTGEVNYYSVPKWGIFTCDMEDISLDIGAGTLFYFEDKTETAEELAERIEQTILDMYDSNKRLEELLNDEEKDVQVELTTETVFQGGSVVTEFGNYILQDGWIEDISKEGIRIYTQNNVDIKDDTNYFVIAHRTNPYSKSEHEIFCQAIIIQLNEYENRSDGTSVKAIGTTTQQGNVVYSFKILVNEEKAMTMHYIVGEKEHCVIQEISYDESEECRNVVQQVIDSFKWN